jgi:hypothetical protein
LIGISCTFENQAGASFNDLPLQSNPDKTAKDLPRMSLGCAQDTTSSNVPYPGVSHPPLRKIGYERRNYA